MLRLKQCDMLALLMCIFVCSVNCAPADDGETTTLSFDTTTTTTAFLHDTRINEVDGKSPNDEVLEEFSTTTTRTTTEEMTTESEIDKRFDIDETTMMSTTTAVESLVETTKESIMDDKIETSTSLPAVHALSDHTNARIMQHYREMLRSQFLRTLLVTLSELKRRQMQQQQQQQHQEEVQESQVVESSMPYSDCECDFDDVSTSDDGKVIVFDESTGKYVYVDGKDLDEKIQERNAQHVSEIQC